LFLKKIILSGLLALLVCNTALPNNHHNFRFVNTGISTTVISNIDITSASSIYKNANQGINLLFRSAVKLNSIVRFFAPSCGFKKDGFYKNIPSLFNNYLVLFNFSDTLHLKWLFMLFPLVLVILGFLFYRLRKKLLVRSKELKFRSGILESANKLLEELLEERRINEQALRESEESFKSLFLQSTDPILLVKNNRFIDCNPSTLNFLGYQEKEQIIGKTPWELSPPYQPDGQKSEDKAHRVVAETLSKGNNRFEWMHTRADGAEILLEVVLTSIQFKGETAIHVSWRDITKRKKAELAIKESEERYRILVDNQTDLIVKVDGEGRFLFVSPSYCRLFGKNPEDLLGKAFLPLVHPDDREATEVAMKKLYQPPFHCSLEQRALTVDGWKWLSWVDTAILDEKGEVREIIGVGRDISDSMGIRNELIKQKKFIQTVLDNLTIGVAINHVDSGKASYMNKKFVEIYGWPAEELVNITNFFRLVYPDPDFRNEIMTRIFADIESGDPSRMKWEKLPIITSQGDTRYVSAVNIPIPEQNIMVSTVVDVTDDFLSDKEAEKERSMLKMLFLIAQKIGHSDSFEEALQYTIEQVCLDTGWDIGEAWLPDQDDEHMVYSGAYFLSDDSLMPFVEKTRDYSFVREEGIPGKVWVKKQAVWFSDLKNDIEFLRYQLAREYNICTGVGIPIIANDLVVSILIFFIRKPKDVDEKLLHIVSAIGLQLGELFQRKSIFLQQQQTLQKLRESDYQLKRAQKIASIGSWEYDFNTMMVSASEQARKIYGVKNEKLTIPELQSMVVDRYRHMLNETFEQHKQTGTPYDVVFQIVRDNDQQPRFIHSMAEFNHQENKLIGIIRDVTDLKSSERLKQEILVANESARFKQKFLAQISHEIRTPLTAIEGMLELIEKTKLDATQTDFIDTVKFSSENLKNIINEVLDYSKIEAGGISLNPVDFALEELYVRAGQLFASLSKSECRFQTLGLDNLPKYIHADKHRIFQIITNFISNALKYACKGVVTLEIKQLAKTRGDKNFFKVLVHDQGPGIGPQLREKLFKPFSQIHKESDIPIEGTGLGLSICKELASLLDGEIDVDSEPGNGSSFWFTFSANIVNEIRTQPAANTIENTIHPKGLQILLAEDKDVNQKVISLILTSMGHHIVLARNGKEATEIFEPGKFDLVLMDIQMPVMDGVEATQTIKQKFPDLTTPIVGLSASAMKGDREHYIQQGLDDYITKPVKTNDFLLLVQRLKLTK